MAVRLNTNEEHVKAIKEALKANDGYCPCAFDKTDDTKCMCKEFRDCIKNPDFTGECHCGLYVKE